MIGGEESGPKGLSVRPEDPDNAFYLVGDKIRWSDRFKNLQMHPAQTFHAAKRASQATWRGLVRHLLLENPVCRCLAVDTGAVEDRQHVGVDVDHQV